MRIHTPHIAALRTWTLTLRAKNTLLQNLHLVYEYSLVMLERRKTSRKVAEQMIRRPGQVCQRLCGFICKYI